MPYMAKDGICGRLLPYMAKDGVCGRLLPYMAKDGVCGRITGLPRPRQMPAARGSDSLDGKEAEF
jgi:hypothetical protein